MNAAVVLFALLVGVAAGWLVARRRFALRFRRDGGVPADAYQAVVEALNAMGEGLVVVEHQRFSFVNDAFCELLGQERSALLALPGFERVLYGDERARVLENYRRRSAGEDLPTHYETVLVHRDGEPIAVEFSVSSLPIHRRRAVVVAVRDIRARKRAEQELRLHRDRLQELVEQRTAELALEKEWAQVTLESVGDAVITTDQDARITYMSPAAEQLTAWSRLQAAGRPTAEVVRVVDETRLEPLPDPAQRCLREGRLRGLGRPSLLLTRDNAQLAIELSAAPIHDRAGTPIGAVLVLHDVSEQRRLTQRLSHQATHDALTGLTNRTEFERRLKRLVESARGSGLNHALCYLDLDQFKVVNDSCGHGAGDELLRQLSRLLKQQMRTSDTLARLGGDEFGVLLENCPPERAEQIAQELLETIRQFRFAWEDKTFGVGASIGLVAVDATTPDLHSAMRAADAACYSAKDKGRNRVHVYTEDDTELARRHGEMQWVSRLRDALERDRFCLYYQPIVRLDSARTLSHCEILLRLVDDDGTIVPPGAFIPAAERYNMMAELDRWVIRKLVAWYADFSDRDPLRELPLFGVNLSGTSLNDENLVQYVRKVLAEYKVSPESLCFEITETATIANITLATEMIAQLRRTGCAFALDDFGIGMSSFAYLKNLPVDYLKIDGNFVRDILDDPLDEAMVDAINRLGHVMGIKTIAEYVENDEIADRLQKLGVDYAQGYGIALPRPLEEFS